MKRDGSTCVICGSQERPEADHIKSFRQYPVLRYSIDNGRVLCHECHKKTDTYGAKQLKGFRHVKSGDEYGTS